MISMTAPVATTKSARARAAGTPPPSVCVPRRLTCPERRLVSVVVGLELVPNRQNKHPRRVLAVIQRHVARVAEWDDEFAPQRIGAGLAEAVGGAGQLRLARRLDPVDRLVDEPQVLDGCGAVQDVLMHSHQVVRRRCAETDLETHSISDSI